MKRIVNGKTYTIEPGTFPVGTGKHRKGYSVHATGPKKKRSFIGIAFQKSDGWYCRGAGCESEHFGGGLMKDAIASMIKKRR